MCGCICERGNSCHSLCLIVSSYNIPTAPLFSFKAPLFFSLWNMLPTWMPGVNVVHHLIPASTEAKDIFLPGQRFKVSSQEQYGASQFSFSTNFLDPMQTQQGLSLHDGIQYGLLKLNPSHFPQAKWWPVIFYWLTLLTYSNKSHFSR